MDKIRIMMRWKYTNALYAAPQAERQKLWEDMGRFTEKWTSAGVKIRGAWVSTAYVDGFDHYVIWEVPDVDTVRQMHQDWSMRETAKYTEGDYQIGWAPPWDAGED